MDNLFKFMKLYEEHLKSVKNIKDIHSDITPDINLNQDNTTDLNIKWIEINNYNMSCNMQHNRMLYMMCNLYKTNFPNFLDLNPQEVTIINLTVSYSSLLLDMLSETVETISINNSCNKSFSNKVNVYITRKYPFLKNIVVNVDNINNMKDLAKYTLENNINLHVICNHKEYDNSNSNSYSIVETYI